MFYDTDTLEEKIAAAIAGENTNQMRRSRLLCYGDERPHGRYTAEKRKGLCDVRFTPESRHVQCTS
jgi:hypothetical protein